MHGQMPQEIEVWYIIPSLRRELAKAMIQDCQVSQKAVAEMMGLTEAAVSQYLHSKRAKDIVFEKRILQEIKQAAQRIVANPASLLKEMMQLTKQPEIKHVMCELHRKHDGKLEGDCSICFDADTIPLQR